MDVVNITILEDGTIKTETDRISTANHVNAEGFLREIFKLAGGRMERKFKRGVMGLNQALNAHAKDGHHHEHH